MVINSVSRDRTAREVDVADTEETVVVIADLTATDPHTVETEMGDEAVSEDVVVGVDMGAIVEVVHRMVAETVTGVTVEDEEVTVVPQAEADTMICVVVEDSALNDQLLPLPLVSMLATCCLMSRLRILRRSLRGLVRSSLLLLPLTTED